MDVKITMELGNKQLFVVRNFQDDTFTFRRGRAKVVLSEPQTREVCLFLTDQFPGILEDK